MAHTQDVLPIELWDLIIQEFDISPPFLLVLATVCRAFNQLCIARYLLIAGVSPEDLAIGTISLEGHHLPVLQFACCTPPIERLSCTGFANESLLSSLQFVRKVVENSPKLQDLTLEFPCDLFQGYLTDTADSQKSLLAAACGLMQIVSSRIAGPVIVMSDEALFRCTSADILAWRLHDAEVNSAIGRARSFLGRTQRAPGYSVIRDDAGKPIKINLISLLCSLSVRSIPSVSAPINSCTLITINPHLGRFLRLGRRAPSAHSSLSDSELSAILPHIAVPALLRGYIDTPGIAPTTLAQFLLRHPTLTSLAYNPSAPDVCMPLLSAPIAHPGLTSISVADLADLVPLLDAVGPSPTLSTISLPYTRGTPALAAALARIAAHPRPVNLVLHLSASARTHSLSADERAAAQGLQRVAHIVVACPSVAAARALLPWLDLLPALRRVEFSSARGIFRWGSGRRDAQGETVRFLEDAMGALPRVAEVIVRETPVVMGM